MVITEKDKEMLKNAIMYLMTDMQKDAMSAVMYENNEFGRMVYNKIVEYQTLLERLK
jgi:hypothetical protein